MELASQQNPGNESKPSLALPLPQLSQSQRFLSVLACSADPAEGLRELRSSGVIEVFLPEVAETWGVFGEQDQHWHPEGNVWEHSLIVVDGVKHSPSQRLRLAAFFHDIGKPLTSQRWPLNGGISNHGHAEVGSNLFATRIGPRLGLEQELISDVALMIRYHMLLHDVRDRSLVPIDLLNYLLALPCIEDLIELQHADCMGTGQDLALRTARSNREFMNGLVQKPGAQ